jgi:cytosine/adenosine deaminase-related metal-dependent hydrolase
MARPLIRGATIVSVDPDIGDLPVGDVLVNEDRIAAVAPKLDLHDAEDIDTVDGNGRIVLPGLINSHLHTWQTALRGT